MIKRKKQQIVPQTLEEAQALKATQCKDIIEKHVYKRYNEAEQRTLSMLASSGNVDAIAVWDWVVENLKILKIKKQTIVDATTIEDVMAIACTGFPYPSNLKKFLEII